MLAYHDTEEQRMTTQTQQMTGRTMSMTGRTVSTAQPRPIPEVVRDVSRWQADLICGRDPGATPVGETGWPLSRRAARTYFGVDVLGGETCALT